MATDNMPVIPEPETPLEIARRNSDDIIAISGKLKGSEEDVRTVTQSSGYGGLKTATTSLFLGINHRGYDVPAQPVTEQYGLVFFTRPRLNLSYDNISRVRDFTLMLNPDDTSVARIVRAILDPDGNDYPDGASRLIDPKMPFISLLSNLALTVNGWPDPYNDTYTSKAGLYKEEVSFVDGTCKIYNAYDLSASFQNIVGDPLGYLFHIWTQYASYVHEGLLDPHPSSVLENEIDYNTRIYRLTMDPGRNFVYRIVACGAAFPVTNSIGASGNYAVDKPYNRDMDQLSVSFRAMGAMYYDPILIKEFNELGIIFNPSMADGFRDKELVKLAIPEKRLFKNTGYPRINNITMELEWWVKPEDYRAVMGDMSRSGIDVPALTGTKKT